MSAKFYILKIAYAPRKLRRELLMYWNRFWFWLHDFKFGKNLKVSTNVYIRKTKKSKVVIGNNFTLHSGNGINPLARNIKACICASNDSVINIGNNVGMSCCVLWANSGITIGDNVLIGADSILLDSDSHSLDHRVRAIKHKKCCEHFGESDFSLLCEEYNVNINKVSKNELDSCLAKSSPITIEDNVLIGSRCIILKGVTIGARSVIGAGSVVTKSIPEDCIAVGNPARIIRLVHFGK